VSVSLNTSRYGAALTTKWKLPGTLPSKQVLTMFADGRPTNIVIVLTLHDTIITSLNEPNKALLPNLYLLFDQVIRLDNNAVHSCTLHNDIRSHNMAHINPPIPSNNPISSTSRLATTPASAEPTPNQPILVTKTHKCSNCSGIGHTDATCFQPGGGMEGRRRNIL